MHFLSFKFKNFKGISDEVIDFLPTGSNVFTLIGLNESGKTTILEAIRAFSWYEDRLDAEALYTRKQDDDPSRYVPKFDKSNFSGVIAIEAKIAFASNAEKEKVIQPIESLHNCDIDRSSVPDWFVYTRGYQFKNSDFERYVSNLSISLKAKKKRSKRFSATTPEIWNSSVKRVNGFLPHIVYSPTFLFEIPKRIVINPDKEEQKINRLYREVIESAAASLSRPLDIQSHIVERIVNKETLMQAAINYFTLAPDKQEQIQAAVSEISEHISNTIFDAWSKIFGGRFNGREVVLRLNVDNETQPPEICLSFRIKDGAHDYDIEERSLGFRWFFSFLLFNVYGRDIDLSSPTLFLLDEPASNLHSGEQLQLLESFANIASGDTQILYSTHSHYMINPEWLNQAFIVSNSAVEYFDFNAKIEIKRSPKTHIRIEKYRSFVGSNPDKITYFQPVLDKLSVVPSKIDLLRPSIVVEGKGDYLLIEYGRRVLLKSESRVAIVPTRGTTGITELIGLFLGWSIPFAACLDADKEGLNAVKDLREKWCLGPEVVFSLSDVDPSFRGKKIEDILSADDLRLISEHYGVSERPSKGQIQLFFSEKLATHSAVNLSEDYVRFIKLFEAIASRVG